VLIDGAVARPNGLTLTNDGKTLIVDDTIGPTVFAYDVQPDGTVKNKRAFGRQGRVRMRVLRRARYCREESHVRPYERCRRRTTC
jgi:hypothetical protein